MDIRGRSVLLLGGTGLVGTAVARRLLEAAPSRIVVGGLHREEAEETVRELSREPGADDVELVPEWGDVFLPESRRGESRRELLSDEDGRSELLDQIFGRLGEGDYSDSALVSLLERHQPDIIVDGINTATAIAYQDLFASAEELRRTARREGGATTAQVEAHLSTLYLPQLIRHVQLLLEGLRRAGTSVYVKVGTSGTGGMGLNIPFTHSEERPSWTLLAKASIAGAHSLLLYLMARTPDAPTVKEVKPTAAIGWKEITYGTVDRGGEPMARFDSTAPLPLDEALAGGDDDAWQRTDDPVRSVYLDAGENGLFSLGEFEAISSLGMMELVTPEEIAEVVVDEIEGRPTGKEVVASLDAAGIGPSYRGGSMREAALQRMEELERRHDVHSVAFEMLGPPRLSKLLFEAHILGRLHRDVEEASELDETAAAREARELVEADARLRSDILSIGIPILFPDGRRMLRGPELKVRPPDGTDPTDGRWAAQGWVDLRSENWVRWRERCRRFLHRVVDPPGAEVGSRHDLDVRARSGEIRPGVLAAWVFRVEDEGAREKR